MNVVRHSPEVPETVFEQLPWPATDVDRRRKAQVESMDDLRMGTQSSGCNMSISIPSSSAKASYSPEPLIALSLLIIPLASLLEFTQIPSDSCATQALCYHGALRKDR